MSLMPIFVWSGVLGMILDLGVLLATWHSPQTKIHPKPKRRPLAPTVGPLLVGSSRPGENPADAVGRTVGWVENRGLTGQGGEVAAQSAQVLDPVVDLDDAKVDQLGDMGTGSFTSVSDTEDFSQFGEGQPDRLSGSDEGQPVYHRRAVLPITGWGPVGLGEEPRFLIEADRRCGDPDFARYLTDLHNFRLALDIQLYLKVYLAVMTTQPERKDTTPEPIRLAVEGMTCDHCETTVTAALR